MLTNNTKHVTMRPTNRSNNYDKDENFQMKTINQIFEVS